MSEHHPSATAHLAWDRRWQTPEGRAEWLAPEPALDALIDELTARGARQALDLGCGVGRHALHLARHGFAVEACDASRSGLDFAAAAARELGLTLGLSETQFFDLPYADGQFDFVVAWNVIYHGDPAVVGRAVAEIGRVLRPGGLYLGTMLTKRNVCCGCGREVAPDTFVDPGNGDKDHPHFYCDAQDLTRLFAGFEVLNLAQVEHGKPGSWHWHLVAERRR